MKVVLMAGGKGTRISSLDPETPKPLLKIDGIPVLEREILLLKEQGFKDFILTLSHLGKRIIDYFKDGKEFGVSIDYFFEDVPLGNAGALFKIKDKLSDEFLLLNADVIFDVDFNRMIKFHYSKKGLVTLLTHPNSHPYDSSIIVSNNNDCVIKWVSKEDKEKNVYYKNKVNAGIHIINKKILDRSIDKEKIDLDRDLLRPLVNEGVIFSYDSSEYVKDMGTIDRFNQVTGDLRNGIVSLRNLKNPQSAVFLDRDGTINKYLGFLTEISKFELLPSVIDAIKLLNSSKYLSIVITNQPVIARGELSVIELDSIHNYMETLLGNEGAFINDLFYCPHHPDSGYEGEIKELKIKCNCRKPGIGLLERAKLKYNIDFSKSFMIGDSEIDIVCGKNAGCKTILITNVHSNTFNADYVCENLLDAVKIILGDKNGI